jgi:uncharacterized protein YgbK (DUF1537 family)
MTDKDNPLIRPLEKAIKKLFHEQQKTLVIIDDDPTGTQTAHDVPVLGHWTEDAFINEFQIKTHLFFVLANTRSLTEEQAVRRAMEIGNNLRTASRKTNRDFILISRSDSTLRGHFPTEVDAIGQAAGLEDHAILLIPAFFEGGRITENNTHFILENHKLVPVAETAFAKDKSFGYENSDLLKWVEEKSKGKIKSEAVKSLSINEIHSGEETILKKLISLKGKEIMVINCTTYTELERVCLVLHQLIKEGKGFIYRTAASFVSAFAGISAKEWKPQKHDRGIKEGGLIIVGSYVPKTTSQLDHLLPEKDIVEMPLSVEKIVRGGDSGNSNIHNLVQEIERYISAGKHVAIYTSRQLITGANQQENLTIGERVTDFLVEIVARIKVQPSFILAKGGITSNDIAVRGLGMKRAIVLGQIIPGVPVWELGEETRFPHIPYVVYPGNVGDDHSLVKVFRLFTDNPPNL